MQCWTQVFIPADVLDFLLYFLFLGQGQMAVDAHGKDKDIGEGFTLLLGKFHNDSFFQSLVSCILPS
jgi:hypothetical protein